MLNLTVRHGHARSKHFDSIKVEFSTPFYPKRQPERIILAGSRMAKPAWQADPKAIEKADINCHGLQAVDFLGNSIFGL